MSWRILTGDVRETLPTVESGTVQTCVTSPPYFGLRDYGTASWHGGDPSCDHVGENARTAPAGSEKQASNHGAVAVASGDCAKCGAERIDSQIGLEQTPDAYVAELVAVFREVRRVLRDDGTLWLNLGDSYNSASQHNHGKGGAMKHAHLAPREGWAGHRPLVTSLKLKDLVGIPWRVAFALQADGWYLRQDIIWHKPNPMPESVTDRCTKAHEYVFLLTKSERYYFDAEAISEASVIGAGAKRNFIDNPDRKDGDRKGVVNDGTRNKRSVWTVTTKPFADAHFATFPPDLIRPMIRAGSRPGDLVLDPFNGAGTTGLVATQEGRRYVGCELNPAYVEMAERRIGSAVPLFGDLLAHEVAK